MALGGDSMAQQNEGMAPRYAKTPRPNTGLVCQKNVTTTC